MGRAGLRAARARGRNGGRPAKLDSGKVHIARVLLDDRKASVADVCETSRTNADTDGDGRFDTLVAAVAAVSRDDGLRPVEGTLTARVEPGTVRAELTFAR